MTATEAEPIAKIEAALFDFDGTLAPNLDLPDMRRQVIDLTQQTKVPAEVYADRYIVEVIDAATQWLELRHPEQAQRYHSAAHQLIIDIEITAARQTEPFTGIRDRLADWGSAGIKRGVVTRNCREAVLIVFPDLMNYVDALYARDDTEYLKPDPQHLLRCLNALNAAPQRSAMIGDGRLDMHAGKQLDMYCIGVLSGSADHAELTTAGAHLVVEHCRDIEMSALQP